MNSSKNVGRKRLGRIAITTSSTKSITALSRPCQIIQRNNGVKTNVPRSSGNYHVDLSFSSSFANDLDNDVDLMSALDKMETDYGQRSEKMEPTNLTKAETAATRVSKISSDSNEDKINSNHTAEKNSLVNQDVKKCHITPRNFLNFACQSTPARNGSKHDISIVSRAKSTVSNSFHDLSFASPMEISTPKIFRSKRLSSGSKRSSTPRHRTLSASKIPVTETICKENVTATSKIRTATLQVTPRRSLRVNSTQKVQKPLKKKRVFEGLDDNCKRTSSNDNHDKSDFFKSLFVENISLEESDIGHGSSTDKITTSVEKRNLGSGVKKIERSQNKSSNVVAQVDKDIPKNNEQELEIDITSKSKCDVAISRSVEPSSNHIQASKENKNEDTDKICLDDLPHIPTRRDNKENNSMSVVGKTLEFHPGLEADQLELLSWGLPESVLKQYHGRGITHMFQWQAECLLLGNVLGGGNLVYSAPTSAGKTMVAELLVLKRVLETRKKAIIILPFVSVTREKMFYLQELYQDAGIRVSGFMGHYAPAGGFSSVDVAVCTIEKGNGLINRMLQENKLHQLGIIVVDELHLIGDRHRGYLLELLLTKISYMSQKSRQAASSETRTDIQVVGMSATLPNLDLLAQWLSADVYRTDYRPVPLTECVKIGTAIYDSSMQLVRDIDTKYAVKGDEDHVVPLCIETIGGGHSILIFCPTKKWCEKLSETVARELYNLLKKPTVAVTTQGFVKASDLLVLPLDQSALRDTVEQLRRTPVGLDSVLGRTVPFGVAYHHAGLTFDERDIVEGAFRHGILKVLIATSTLSSGVNLPARRVLIRTPVFHGHLIDFLTYKQMIGRAGRKGVDTAGESILLCKPNERCKADRLVRGTLPAVQSTLIRSEGEPLSSSMKRAILEVVVSGVAMSPAEVSCYASCTLLTASLTKEENQTQDLIQQCLQFLQEHEFVCTQKLKGADGLESERFVPTQLGAAVLASSMSPDEGLVVFSELRRARQCFVLENELHIVYQVTPIYAQIDSIDWYQYFSIWETLTTGMKKVAELVGIQESFLAKAVRGRILTKTSAQLKLLAIHKRFYTALVLLDLVQETPVNVVARKYNCNKGQLQSLQQSAATFAGMVTVFCARLGWSNLELILSQFQNRLTFGIQRELCDLVRISAVNGQRARVMYNGGYQTVAALASAHPADIEALLKNSAPFQSNKKQDTESEWEAEERRKTRCIFLTGRRGVTEYEASLAIIQEAKSIIQEELGGLGIQWKAADSEPGPSLKSPVLLSPLATAGKGKKVHIRRSSNSKLRKGPPSKGGDCNKPPIPCVISPPATKPDSKVAVQTIAAKGNEVDQKLNEITNSEACAVTQVQCVKSVVQENQINTADSGLVEIKQIGNGNKTVQSVAPIGKTSTENNDTEKYTEESNNAHVKWTTSEQYKHDGYISKNQKVNATLKSSRKIDENSAIVHRNIFTTTAIVETVPIQLMISNIQGCQTSIGQNVATVKGQSYLPEHQTDVSKLLVAGEGVFMNDDLNESKLRGVSSEKQSENNVDEVVNFDPQVERKEVVCVRDCVKRDKHRSVTFTTEPVVEIDKSNIEKSKKRTKYAIGGNMMQKTAIDTSDNVETCPKTSPENRTKNSVYGNENYENNMPAKETQHNGRSELNVVEKQITCNAGNDMEKNGGSTAQIEQTLVDFTTSNDKGFSFDGNDCYGKNKECKSKVNTITENQAKIINDSRNESGFGESFLIDTQSMKSLDNLKNVKILDENSSCVKTESRQTGNSHKKNKIPNNENIFSEALFSEDFHMDSSNVSSRNVIVHWDASHMEVGGKVGDNDAVDEQITGGNGRTDLHFNISDTGTDVDMSQNALDMNISQGSNEGMFSESVDLVAASNYDWMGLSGDSRIVNPARNDSYHDLHIPYQSGQEKCFERTDAPNACVGNGISTVCKNKYDRIVNNGITEVISPAFGQQLTILGQFSSQKQSKAITNCHGILHEDLAMALEMGESFSSTFNVPTQSESKVVKVIKPDYKESHIGNIDDDKLGDSLTISMVEKVLEESNEIPGIITSTSTCSTNVGTCELNNAENKEECHSKQSCDEDLKTNAEIKSNQNVKHKSLLNTNNPVESLSECEFITPRREAVKRLLGNLAVRKSKIQKTNASGYSTPVALEKHTRRISKKPSNHIVDEDYKKSECSRGNRRKRKSDKNVTPVSEKTRRRSVTEMNTSTGSDCVPPTPPDEAPTSLLGSSRTPSRTPLVTLSPFSPRLKNSVKYHNDWNNATVKDTSSNVDHKTSLQNKRNSTAVRNKSGNDTHGRNIKCTSLCEKSESANVEGRAEANTVSKANSNHSGSTEENQGETESWARIKGKTERMNTGMDLDHSIDETEHHDDETSEIDNDKADDDVLSPSFIDPDQAGIPLTQSSFTIIDVCADKRLFKTFIMEWRTKARYAVSLACERRLHDCPGGGIGANFKQGAAPTKQSMKDCSGIPVTSLGIQIVGVAVSWENRDAYYVSFTHEQPTGDPDDSLAPPPCDTDVTIAIRVKAVKSVLQQAECKGQAVTMVMFDMKAHYRALAEGCGFAPMGQFEDPKIACWMLDPGVGEKNLHRMVTNLLPTEVHLLHGIGGGIGVSSIGMSPQNPGSGRYRATTEAVLVRHLGEYFRACLEKEEIYGVLRDIEMPCAVALCRMELNGFGFSQDESESQKMVMVAKLSALEDQAYNLAGHPFSLSATEDVAQVLFLELQLPPNGDPTTMSAPRSLVPKRGAVPRRGRGKPQYSTSKDVLEKLKKLHPLPGVILEWRRITNALTKTVFPLQKQKVYCDWLSMNRIYGDVQLHTATGRVSMTEPNLQNVPKDFDILLPDLIGENPPPNATATIGRRTRAGNSRLQQMIGQPQAAKVTGENPGSQFCVSMRHAFVPFQGGVLLAADYSQLELRMIAYLSRDQKLMGILNQDVDVFKLITAQWKNVRPEDVTPEQRAQAKQVCYGMIYGIGAKALGDQLDVEENDAAVFIETFKAKYPAMRTYLRHTVEECRRNGYVQTMVGRKRYLQAITSASPHARSQAERQAINTTVQGSAADLVKMALIRVNERLAEMFPHTQYTHRHKLSGKHPARAKTPPDGAYLVLQLHDELIYEVAETHVHTIAQIVKHCMETAMQLPVKMPVKIKVGPSWGKLQDYDI